MVWYGVWYGMAVLFIIISFVLHLDIRPGAVMDSHCTVFSIHCAGSALGLSPQFLSLHRHNIAPAIPPSSAHTRIHHIQYSTVHYIHYSTLQYSTSDALCYTYHSTAQVGHHQPVGTEQYPKTV